MWKLLRWLTSHVFGPIILWYTKRDRTYHYEGLTLLIKRGVFHPRFFFSTKFLLRAIKKQELANKTALELGAGSGLISFYMANRGAQVTATDISTIAIEGLQVNKTNLKSTIHIIHSDLFAQIPAQSFDYIIINPPYYPKNPNNQEEMAWFCGTNHEYFHKLFVQLGNYMPLNTIVWMSLSEDCNITQIKQIAENNNFFLTLAHKKRIIGELNYIYQIIKK